MDKTQAMKFLKALKDFDPVTMALTELTLEMKQQDARLLRKGIGEVMGQIILLEAHIYSSFPDLKPDET